MKNYPPFDVRQIKNLKEMINSSAVLYADRVAFLSKSNPESEYSKITYAQYKKDIDAFGTALCSLGMKGKRIAIMGENRYEWSISYLAVLNGTGTVIPIDRELPVNEIENAIARLDISMFIYSDKIEEKIQALKNNADKIEYFVKMGSKEDNGNHLGFLKLLEKGHELVSQGNRDFIDAEIDAEAIKILLLTSATTDESKVVMLSHKNIASNIMSMNGSIDIRDNDVFLSILPIHHVYECTCGFLTPLFKGGSIAYCDGLKYIIKNLAESKTTILLAVPLIVESMYKRIFEQAEKTGMKEKLLKGIKISNLLKIFHIDMTKKLFHKVHETFGGNIRLIISGAAGIDPDVSKGFRALGLHVIQGYGLTECSPILAVNKEFFYKDAAAGIALTGVEIKIDNPDSDGIGEILAKGENVMSGYYDNPDATAKAFKDGWFCTGDLGKMDSDGFVYITGRKKNVIVTKNGKNIFPEEIETLLGRSPYVLESMVYGRKVEDTPEEIITAIIVPNIDKIKELTGSQNPTADEINDLIKNEVKIVNSQLVNYKHIKDITIRETEFIKTTTKKIKRYKV